MQTEKHGRTTKTMRTKAIAVLLAAVLVVFGVVGGTVAWLIDKTDAVKNTFTYGDINIDLTETTGEDYKMTPGEDIDKDPLVTVLKGSEACWLFVKIEESANFDSFMEYTVADGWTPLAGEDGIYYREVEDTLDDTADTTFGVLKDDKVTVLESVTKDMMEGIKNDPTTEPTLTFTAYAVQKVGFDTAAAAWAEAEKI